MSDIDTEVAPDTSTDTAAPVETTDSTPAPTESLRDTIERAYTEAETAQAEAPTDKTKPGATATQRARDDSGRFSSTPKPKTGAVAATKAPQSSSTASLAPPSPVQGTQPTEVKPTAPALRPPQSWKPMAREKWSSLDPAVQQEIVRVDGEVRQVMSRAAQAQQQAQAFERIWRPYEGMIRGAGAEPLQVAASLFQTYAGLRSSPPWEKHQLMADIIVTQGGDLEMLSQALAQRMGGQPPQGQAPRQAPVGAQGGYRDPRVDELLAREQQREQRTKQEQFQRIHQDIDTFAKEHEFLDDLREDMADLHQAASLRGRALSFEESYAAAMALPQHAELRAVLSQRKEAEAAKATNANAQRSRLAASSIRSSPVAPMRTGGQPNSFHDALAANWDAVFSGR